ncbi:MAG: CocE/NonD family hydrolase C-terminal non-catalytic domain-containing protein [Planctomycetota bacterium]
MKILLPFLFAAVAAVATATATTVAAQTPPPGGFPIAEVLDVPVTYSDGYRTLLDVRHPDVVTPPLGGFPVLLVVHGGSASRKVSWAQSVARQGAKQGYVTLAYDTGNNGATLVLNPPGNRSDERRMTDMAAILDQAEVQLGAMADETRIAIFGKSGGGKHALWGACFSGQPLLVPGSVTQMPVISAIHTDIQVLDRIGGTVLQGAMLKSDWVRKVILREGPTGPTTVRILARDYAGIVAVMQADPMELLPRIQATDVPMAVSYAYDDAKHFVNINADVLQTMLPTTPTRYLQLTGGHGSVANDVADELREDFTIRWCDRWLKGVGNDVMAEPFADIAVLPSAPARYLDPQTEWQHRQVEHWPMPPTQRLFLRAGGALTAQAPTAMEVGPTIEHRVATGYDIVDFAGDNLNPAVVSTSIPLVAHSFDTPPLPEPRELLGRTVVELDVTTTGADCQLQAALLDVAPGGASRFVTCGVSALRNAAAGRHHLRIELGDVGYVLQQGHRLRLSLENVNLRRQPGHVHYFVAPDFDDVDIEVMIDPAFEPFVDLPLTLPGSSLVPRFGRATASGGFLHELTLEGEALRAGSSYQILLGISGSAPGIPWGPWIVPVAADALTSTGVLLTNTPLLQQFAGTLDVDGRAAATLAIPPSIAPLLLGQRLTFAAYGIDLNGAEFATPFAELVVGS